MPNDIKLWLVTGTTCTRVQLDESQITISNGDVTIDFANIDPAPTGSYYVISVKYDTGSVTGQNASGKPTVKFTITTSLSVGGTIVETDAKGITLAPKPSGKPTKSLEASGLIPQGFFGIYLPAVQR